MRGTNRTSFELPPCLATLVDRAIQTLRPVAQSAIAASSSREPFSWRAGALQIEIAGSNRSSIGGLRLSRLEIRFPTVSRSLGAPGKKADRAARYRRRGADSDWRHSHRIRAARPTQAELLWSGKSHALMMTLSSHYISNSLQVDALIVRQLSRVGPIENRCPLAPPMSGHPIGVDLHARHPVAPNPAHYATPLAKGYTPHRHRHA